MVEHLLTTLRSLCTQQCIFGVARLAPAWPPNEVSPPQPTGSLLVGKRFLFFVREQIQVSCRCVPLAAGGIHLSMRNRLRHHQRSHRIGNHAVCVLAAARNYPSSAFDLFCLCSSRGSSQEARVCSKQPAGRRVRPVPNTQIGPLSPAENSSASSTDIPREHCEVSSYVGPLCLTPTWLRRSADARMRQENQRTAGQRIECRFLGKSHICCGVKPSYTSALQSPEVWR